MEAPDVQRKVGSGRQMRGNLYITRACADVWKGTRQLVYELIILSFFPSLSLLSLSLPCCAVCLRLIRSRPPFHSVLSSCPFHSDCASVTFGLAFMFGFIRI